MTPKAKFTKEEISAAALNIVKNSGADALTARSLGNKLGSSARPVFTVFSGMEEVQAEVVSAAKAVYKNMGTDGVFGRSDIASITGDSVTAAGNLISKLKAASLIAPVKGYGKGKYHFIEPHK